MTTTTLAHDVTGWTGQDWCDQLADLACIGGATISMDWDPGQPDIGVTVVTVSNGERQETRPIPTPRIATLLQVAAHCIGVMVWSPEPAQVAGATRLHGQVIGLARELTTYYGLDQL